MTIGGYIVLALADGPKLPPDLGALLVGIVGLYVIAHLAVRRLAPRAVGTLLPLAAILNGVGFVTIARLDRDLARIQSIWSAVGVGAFVLTLVVVRSVRNLERYTYTFAFVALALLLVPLVPHVGLSVNGARIWAHFGPLHFQPGEPAKVLWVAFFAGYLTQKRELLSEGSRSIGRLRIPARATSARCSPRGASRFSCSCSNAISDRRCCSSQCSRRCSTWPPSAART